MDNQNGRKTMRENGRDREGEKRRAKGRRYHKRKTQRRSLGHTQRDKRQRL